KGQRVVPAENGRSLTYHPPHHRAHSQLPVPSRSGPAPAHFRWPARTLPGSLRIFVSSFFRCSESALDVPDRQKGGISLVEWRARPPSTQSEIVAVIPASDVGSRHCARRIMPVGVDDNSISACCTCARHYSGREERRRRPVSLVARILNVTDNL